MLPRKGRSRLQSTVCVKLIIKVQNMEVDTFKTIIKKLAINNYHWILLAAKCFLLFFCRRFLLTSFLLILTKYLINLFIYLAFFGELYSADPAFQVLYNRSLTEIALAFRSGWLPNSQSLDKSHSNFKIANFRHGPRMLFTTTIEGVMSILPKTKSNL